ncbi:MAG: hypothetical protein E6Q97_34685 [Desulfurellales bacterium]|nr:MAG: hypothetical protein E6Q97_34685 [Desulfurellales bacterium]
MTSKVIALTASLSMAGCALNRPRLSERTTTTSTNGVVTVQERTLKVTSFALWPAHTELERQTASLGKTLSTGTSGLTQEGGGTNVVEALKSLDSILGKIAK